MAHFAALMVENGYLKIPEGNVYFRRYGTGKHLIIALHGFGQDSTAFSRFPLPQEYGLYAVDLPWHGRTEWRSSTFSPASLKAIVDAILQFETDSTHLDLIGFSYGAALWLGALPVLSSPGYRLFLVSPEALGGRWQCWTTGLPRKTRKWLGGIVQRHYPLLLQFAALLEKIHLLHPFARRFLRYHLEDSAKRTRIINTWINLARFSLRHSDVILQHTMHTAIYLLIGEKDPLLDVAKVKKWGGRIPRLKLYILPYGHHLLGKVDWAQLLR
jgi:pimeloyl-ACP methyl ester carboxylesterase